MYEPHKWCIVEVNSPKEGTVYKVFGNWNGGYLDGPSWRMNSGITKVETLDDHYLFHGQSGSVYKCRKTNYGMTGYGYSMMDGWQKHLEETKSKITMKPLKENNDWALLNIKKKLLTLN